MRTVTQWLMSVGTNRTATTASPEAVRTVSKAELDHVAAAGGSGTGGFGGGGGAGGGGIISHGAAFAVEQTLFWR